MKYLQNNGKPSVITIDKQKCIDWWESDGKRKVLTIAWAGREGLEGPETKEKELIKSLGIGVAQKALTYWDKDARIQPGKPEEIAEGRPLGRPKTVYADETFLVSSYPHIVNYECGAALGDKRAYNLPVAGSEWAKKLGSDFVKIANDTDADQLMKIYHFVDEVDESGKVIKKNSFRLKEDNAPVEGHMPHNLLEFDIENAPRKSPGKQAKLERKDDMETT